MNTIKRFYALDAFRGLAALLVFLFHTPQLSVLTNSAFIRGSGFFVDLFFVLSGFVIYHNYKDKLSTFSSSKPFILKRIKRLVPLHVYTLLVLLILEIIKYVTSNQINYSTVPFEANTMASFWPQFFLLNSTPLFYGFNWNGPSWSISAEMITYFLFILTSLLCFRKKRLTLLISLSIVCLGYLFFSLKDHTYNITIDYKYSFIRGFIGFYFGIIIYSIRHLLLNVLNKASKILGHLFEVLILIIVIYIICYVGYFKNYFFIIHMAFGLLILVFSMEKGIISELLKRHLFQKLGQWSYSIYLNHTLMIILYNMILIKGFGINDNYTLLSEILLIILVCAYSSFTYKHIEKRFYNKVK